MGKILLVEDDAVQIELLRRLFEQRGHVLLIARNGKEGIKVAQLEKPQLILMDMIMPGMHGLEVTIKLKEDASTREIPVIALTIMSSPKFVQECYRAGVVGYIKKPYDPKILLESAERVVGKPEIIAGRILIVAGISQFATMLEMRLLRHGYEVTTLRPAEITSGRFDSEKAAAVFIDVSLPESQITMVFETIRAAGGGKDIPVVAFAGGMSKDSLGQTAARHGARFHIASTGELSDLLRTISQPVRN